MTTLEKTESIDGLNYIYSLLNQFKGGINEKGESFIIRNLQINLDEFQIDQANSIIHDLMSRLNSLEIKDPDLPRFTTLSSK